MGNVEEADLAPDGRMVIIQLKLLKSTRTRFIRTRAFSSSRLDSWATSAVSIVPRENRELGGSRRRRIWAKTLSISGNCPVGWPGHERVDQTVGKLNEAVTRIDQVLLSDETLTNLSTAVLNFRILSDRSLVAMDTVDRVLKTNSPAVGASVSNLVTFSEELKAFSAGLRLLVETNRTQFTSSLSNIETATIQVNQLLQGVQEGQGPGRCLVEKSRTPTERLFTYQQFERGQQQPEQVWTLALSVETEGTLT